MEDELLVTNHNFTLDSRVSGPALAVAVAIEFVLSLTSNLFVLIFTLCHSKTMKQPSIIFMTNFVFINLMITILVMPFTIITASAEDWVFGESVQQKHDFCQFTAFIFSFGVQLITLTLAVISIDRFLFIVKPLFYRRYMKTWVAIMTVVSMWILSALINTPPYFGLGEYAFGQFTGTCVQVWVGHRDYVAYLCLIILIIITIISTTSIWTCCFTRKFIKQAYDTAAHSKTSENDHDDAAKHLYAHRMRKLIGIFGILIIITIVSYVPAIVAAVAGIAVGSGNLPAPVITIVILSFFVNTFANPIAQSYFRRDVNEFIVRVLKKITKCSGAMKIDSEKATSQTDSKISTQMSSVSTEKL